MRRRFLALGFALAALIVAGILAWMLTVPTVAVERLRAQPLEQRVVATGRVMSPERIGVGSVVLGTVAEVLVDEGDRVGPGQVLLRLVDEEARAAVGNAQAALSRARAELRQLEQVRRPAAAETQRQAELQLAQARRDHERAQALAAEGFVTRAEAEAREEAFELAASRLRSAREAFLALQPQGSEYQSAVARLAEAEALLEQARARLSYTAVRAPTAATVLLRAVEPGAVVQPGSILLVLASAGTTLIEARLDERNLARVRVGQSALASADAYPEDRFQAFVSFLGPAVDPQRGTVEVKLSVPDPPAYLRADMTVSVDILTAHRERALTVPRSAVRQDQSGPWVLVLREGRAVRQQVTLGLRGDERVELLSGVEPGEAVVLEPSAVRPGRRAREGAR